MCCAWIQSQQTLVSRVSATVLRATFKDAFHADPFHIPCKGGHCAPRGALVRRRERIGARESQYHDSSFNVRRI